jgi:hypothetical protein
LPLRQAEGFLRSLLELMDLSLDAPDHTTLSRRSKSLRVNLAIKQTKKPVELIIDSAASPSSAKAKGQRQSTVGEEGAVGENSTSVLMRAAPFKLRS